MCRNSRLIEKIKWRIMALTKNLFLLNLCTHKNVLLIHNTSIAFESKCGMSNVKHLVPFFSSTLKWLIPIVIHFSAIHNWILTVLFTPLYKIQLVLPWKILMTLSKMVTFVLCPSNETCYNGLMKKKKSSICFPAILDLDGRFSCLSSNFVLFFLG